MVNLLETGKECVLVVHMRAAGRVYNMQAEPLYGSRAGSDQRWMGQVDAKNLWHV